MIVRQDGHDLTVLACFTVSERLAMHQKVSDDTLHAAQRVVVPQTDDEVGKIDKDRCRYGFINAAAEHQTDRFVGRAPLILGRPGYRSA